MPVRVAAGWTALSSGSNHHCGILGGVVRCWGDNADNTVPGAGSAGVIMPTPIAPQPSFTPALVSAGDAFSCVTGRSAGEIECWGRNDTSQVALTGGTPVEPTPVDVSSLGRIISISSAERHSCVADGTIVMCWGQNVARAVNWLAMPDAELSPVAVDLSSFSPASPMEVATGSAFSCARLSDDSVVCWGSDSNGQRGDGTLTMTNPSPVRFDAGASIVQISAGRQHACAVDDAQRLFCWGRNMEGQLGMVGPDADTPVEVLAPP
jgi:alpha-tubulin suppressor-like RCC1 family protein